MAAGVSAAGGRRGRPVGCRIGALPQRSHETSGLEGFSDTVFGFGLTLLVASLEVPSSFDELRLQLEGFFGFGLMFAMVCWIRYEHNWFFRRTGLQDRPSHA